MNRSNVYLKEIEVKDAEFLYELFQCDEYARMFYEESTTVDDWRNRIQDMKENSNSKQFVIRQRTNNEMVGWLGFFTEESDTEYLQMLIIDKPYLRLGYASEVMDILKKHLLDNGKKKIKLSTQEANKRAQSFYIKHGFYIVGTETEEVDAGRRHEQYVVMECTL